MKMRNKGVAFERNVHILGVVSFTECIRYDLHVQS